MVITAAGATFAAAAGVVSIRRGAAPTMTFFLVAALLLVPAGGWARATEEGTIVLLVVALVVSAACLVSIGSASGAELPVLSQGLGGVAAAALIGLAAAIVGASGVDASGDTAGHVGLAAVATASCALVIAALWWRGRPEGPAAEAVAIVGSVVGLAAASDQPLSLAIALTLTVPAAALAGIRADRRGYLTAAAVLAAAAAWAWLDRADVVLVEAYSLTAALAALAAGIVHERSSARTSSWQAMGPGLLLALGPSLVVVVDQGGTARPAVLALAAVATVAVGARTRQQAPLAIGSGVLLVLAADTVGPVAAALPRWLTIGVAGGVLVWMGATADRRLAQLRRARAQFDLLESAAGAPVSRRG
jgi:hypothetical protein